MSEEQARQQARNAPSHANTPARHRRIAPQVPNMLPMNIAGSFGGSIALPPAAPRSIDRPNHPTFVRSGYFSSNPYPTLSRDPTDRLPFGITSSHIDTALVGKSNHMASLTQTPLPGLQHRSPYGASNAPPQTPFRIPQQAIAPGFPRSHSLALSNSFTTETKKNHYNGVEKEKADKPPHVPYTPVAGASRVPSNDVGRKAPLMKDSPMEDPSTNGLRKLAMVEQARSTREPTAPEGPAQPDAIIPIPKPSVRGQGSLKRSHPNQNSSRSKISRKVSTSKDHIKDNDLDADGDTDEEYMPTKSPNQATHVSPTSIVSINKIKSGSSTTMASTHQPTAESSTPVEPAPLRPRYTYVTAAKLVGTEKALGPNWNKFVRLVEDLVLEKISTRQFEAQAKIMFASSDALRNHIVAIIINEMILPKMEEDRLLQLEDQGQE
ncbi:hypothetical protein PtrSN002B_007279 [Pyrenophora tritici-repentis]|nr:hypothetical protein PtrSN002B_007279 [Pyrenophora tritici-repentis]KAI1584887.1 hypothetical protein PtrEW13061_008227 [Pyrenophora tritici-repentis]KAI1671322.1 hypothetical protein L13192_04679 [Pyrenophora tritici-repentis]